MYCRVHSNEVSYCFKYHFPSRYILVCYGFALQKASPVISRMHIIILSHLTCICDRSIFETSRQLSTEEIANYHGIDYIIHWYIMVGAMAPFNLDERESQVLSLQAF
jgi:hypothetical protein